MVTNSGAKENLTPHHCCQRKNNGSFSQTSHGTLRPFARQCSALNRSLLQWSNHSSYEVTDLGVKRSNSLMSNILVLSDPEDLLPPLLTVRHPPPAGLAPVRSKG
eukprot:162140-Hanusia_phi.AAC.1